MICVSAVTIAWLIVRRKRDASEERRSSQAEKDEGKTGPWENGLSELSDCRRTELPITIVEELSAERSVAELSTAPDLNP